MEITWKVISGEGENGVKVQGISSIIGRYKIDRGMLRTVEEKEKPKNLHVRSMDMYQGGGQNVGGREVAGQRGIKGRKNGTTVIP